MNPPADHHRDLAPLIVELLDGSLSGDDRDRLLDLLKSDSEARRAYLDIINLHGQLVWRSSHKSHGDIGQPGGTNVMPHHSAPVVPARSRAPLYAMAAVVLLAGAAVAIYAISALRSPTLNDGPSSGLPVATLIDATDTVVSGNDIVYSGGQIASGTVSIEAGEAEMLLTNRVAISLIGATSMTMHSDMSTALTHGTAEFYCPPGTEGYTVHLPGGARVVDLGTRFRVTIDNGSASRTAVTEGRTELRHGEASTPVVAGQVAVLASDGSLAVIDGDPGEAWLAAFDFDASPDPRLTQKHFESVDGRADSGMATHRGVTMHYVIASPKSGPIARDRGVGGGLAGSSLSGVLRDFTLADTYFGSRLSVVLEGLEPDTAYRLRWYHCENRRDYQDRNIRIAVYSDPAGELLFTKAPYDPATNPAEADHTDFIATADARGRIALATGPYQGGRTISYLNGLAVLGVADTKPTPPTSEPADRSPAPQAVGATPREIPDHPASGDEIR